MAKRTPMMDYLIINKTESVYNHSHNFLIIIPSLYINDQLL